jgi:hypothetical protein
MSQPINRFELQVVFDDGGYLRVTSRRHPPMSRLEVIESLEKYAADLRKSEVGGKEPA